jgi:hypothetical protein
VGVMASLKAGELNLVEAKEYWGWGHRQTKRVWKRRAKPKAAGDSGRPPLRFPASPATRRRENNRQPRGHF